MRRRIPSLTIVSHYHFDYSSTVTDKPFLADRYYLDRVSIYKRGLEKNMHFMKRIHEIGMYDREELEVFHHSIDMNLGASLHWAMFVPTLTR